LTNNFQLEYVRKYASKDVFETADDEDDSDVDMSSVGSFDSEDEDGEAAGRLEV
jgi:ubiquitin-conjugating enzyme E2 H